MGKKIKLNKKGAASFYIVAIYTLVLVIIAVSFAAVIISEINRTSNDDLAQSAYDSAMAGVEDAKLAYYKYRQCEEGTGTDCDMVRKAFNENKGCDMVGRMLGRIQDGSESTEVKIQESSVGDNNMQQSYTCVRLYEPTDDVDTVTESNPIVVKQVKLESANKEVTHMRVSWNVSSVEGEVTTNTEVPAIAIAIVQTADKFKLSEFDQTVTNDGGGYTNRGTVFLVPYSGSIASNDDIIDKGSNGTISKEEGFLKSNNHEVKNKPFYVARDDASGPYSVQIELPCPVGTGYLDNGECSERNEETFTYAKSVVGGKGATDIRVQFCNGPCTTGASEGESDGDPSEGNVIKSKMQIGVDSTGKANDIYRRVDVRLGTGGSESAGAGLLYAVQALGKGNEGGIHKITGVTCEPGFPGCE